MAGSTRSMTYAAGLVAAVALAGCGTGGATPGGPTPVGTSAAGSSTAESPTPTSSASLDPVLARIPVAARPEPPEGAAAFVKYYINEVNAAFKSGDASGPCLKWSDGWPS